MIRRRRRPTLDSGALPPTLEERLREAHDQLQLVVAVCELTAMAEARGPADALSPAAASALARQCAHHADDLWAVLAILPGTVLNWTPPASARGGVRASRAQPDRRAGARADG